SRLRALLLAGPGLLQPAAQRACRWLHLSSEGRQHGHRLDRGAVHLRQGEAQRVRRREEAMRTARLALLVWLSACAAEPPADAREARAAGHKFPGSVLQVEPRLGVPTFLWTRPARRSAATPEAAARGTLAEVAALYRLSAADVAAATAKQVHDVGVGP